jgi:CheY-like chemotaxis protein
MLGAKSTLDLVFADGKMPSAGGEEVLRDMRQDWCLAFIAGRFDD